MSKPSKDPLLIFDGDCAFCTTAVLRLESALPYFPARSPWQWLELDEFGLSERDVTEYAWLVTPRQQFAGHLALSALLRLQPTAGWRFLGHLIATPPFSWIAAVGYQFVARNRHRLPGGTPACAMPRT
jgi:predicted DCC family thiol-disulfide oxidoreductase YuxK